MFQLLVCLLIVGGVRPAVIISTDTSPKESIGYELSATHLESLESQMLEILELLHHQVVGIDSCGSVAKSGLYKLACERCPKSPTVLCEMDSLGGGWLVIQQRLDGSVDFNRNWDEYRSGFGTSSNGTEFWLGLEQIHQITSSGDYELAVELKDGTAGKLGWARYSTFRVAGQSERYKLAELGKYNESGTLGDKLSYHRDQPFSTRDRDNDQAESSCAEYYSGGWWYKRCAECVLNGSYKKNENNNRGISWPHWTYAASYSRMLIRRK